MEYLLTDIKKTYYHFDGNKNSRIIKTLIQPGVQAVIVYRLGNWLQNKNFLIKMFFFIPYFTLRYHVKKWGIDIPKVCKIGKGLYIGHYGNIFISPFAEIGDNCTLSHGVTIGIAGKNTKRGVPIIGHNVYIGPGAKIFGKIKIGDNVKIGANSVIHKNIPSNSVVVSAPGFKIISKNK